MLLRLLFVLIIFRFGYCDEGRKFSFSMLQSNQITGMIPDIDDAYGVSFRDLNQDGHPDIYFACFRNLNRLLINNGGLIPFVDRTIYSGTGGYLMTHGNTNLELGVNVADYDNDGKPDIFLAGWGKTHKLYRNLGRVTFEDATVNLNMQGKVDANQGLWVDVNNDGFLDLYITDEHQSNRLLLNQQNGFFNEALWTETFVDNAVSQGASNCDIDNDGDSDIYVSNWFAADYLLINDGTGLFAKLDLPLQTLTDSLSTNSSAFADIDNDGDSDLFVAGNNGYVYFYENKTDSVIQFTTRKDHPFYNTGGRVFGILFEDFDLDGWLDCFITTRGENRLYLNRGDGTFFNEYDSDKKAIYSTGSSAADVDDDGDLDIVVANKTDNSQVYLNPTNSNRFIKLTFRGVKSNRDAIGTKVYFYTPEDSGSVFLGYREVNVNTSYLSSKEPQITFGMGNHKSVMIKAVFPSGVELIRENRNAGNSYVIREYRGVLQFYYSSLTTLKYLTNRSDFWLNTGLVLCIIIFFTAYLFLGLRRYHWTAFNVGFQLSLWFLISLFLFLFLRSAATYTILVTILSLAVFSFFLLTLYSEHFLRSRRKRDSIRELLQKLSDRIINIHENDELAREVVITIIRHPEIKDAWFYVMSAENRIQLLYGSGEVREKDFEISGLEFQKIKNENILTGAELQFIEKITSDANHVIPVKRKDTVFGVIALNMLRSNKAINQEDIERLIAVASQSAIAIENNNYIKETAGLIEQLTSAKIRKQYVVQLENTNRELDEKNRELNRLFTELRDKEAQLIQSEKMASLGQLVAGISHELNNPISFIYSNMQVISEYIQELSHHLSAIHDSDLRDKINYVLKELNETIVDSSNGSRAIKEIVQDLKNFSRLDQAEWKESRLSEMITTCLKMLRPHLTSQITVDVDLKDDPSFLCNPGQLNQVFLNLLTNACQALKDQGKINISAKADKEYIFVEIMDNGPGIPEKIVKKIFDPFFTTKPVNQGTGLGLSISYSIIKKHQGELTVTSNPGKTLFIVKLPLNLESQPNDK
ncbi:MAG: VCBS repeat-containing protein [Calditrichae bacterium]|nr:VCBS repeat-containing protein [Calditrichia bacterium]